MTRQEAVDKYRHQISGAVLDVLFRKAEGGELSILVRALLRQIDTSLGQMHEELTRPKANGTTVAPARPANGAAAKN